MANGDLLRFLYSFFGLLVGTIFMIAGTLLFLKGVVETKGKAEAQLSHVRITFHDVAPGLGLAILGVVVIFVTRF
jgi:hypothetical protein